MNVVNLCRKENITNHEEDLCCFHVGSLLYLPLFFFSFWICFWWCQMLTSSDVKQPVWYFQWSAVTGCFLQLLIWSLCTQQSGLSTEGQSQIPPGVGAIVAPQATATQGSGLPEHKGCGCLGDDSALGSRPLLSRFSPHGFHPQTLLVCLQLTVPLPLTEPQVTGCKWKFKCWPFKRPLCLQLSVSGREQPCCFFHWLLPVFFLGSDVLGWES